MEPITISTGTIAILSKSLASFLGFMEESSKYTKMLVHAPLQSAKSCFEDAKRSTGDVQRFQHLLQEAEKNFRQAVALEENELKVVALLGLSLCQLLLNDKANASSNFRKIQEVDLSDSERRKAFAKDALRSQIPFRSIFNAEECRNEILGGGKSVRKRYAILEFHKNWASNLMKMELGRLKYSLQNNKF